MVITLSGGEFHMRTGLQFILAFGSKESVKSIMYRTPIELTEAFPNEKIDDKYKRVAIHYFDGKETNAEVWMWKTDCQDGLKDALLYADGMISAVRGLQNLSGAEYYYRFFERGLSGAALHMWENALKDAQDAQGSVLLNKENFYKSVHTWIAYYASHGHDRIQLANYLSYGAKKPRSIPCNQLVGALHKFNKFVAWLPGTQTVLNDEALKLAYVNMMPSIWQKNFTNMGRHACDECGTLQTLCAFFTEMEHFNAQREADNIINQRRNTASGNNRKSYGVQKRSQIAVDTACPVHPGMNHTWGDCYSNVANTRANKKAKWSNTNSNNVTKTDLLARNLGAFASAESRSTMSEEAGKQTTCGRCTFLTMKTRLTRIHLF
jgi:hypothetical protein